MPQPRDAVSDGIRNIDRRCAFANRRFNDAVKEFRLRARSVFAGKFDVVGYAVPSEFGAFVRDLREHVYNSDQAVWSVHCHNDLGLAVANSLSGVVHGGARQIECSINGLGERAGNCALEEVVMAVKTRNDFFKLGVDINTRQLVPTSKLVSSAGELAEHHTIACPANIFCGHNFVGFAMLDHAVLMNAGSMREGI